MSRAHPDTRPTGPQAGDAAKGKATFSMLCVSCHGETGKGDGPVGGMLQPPPRDFSVGEFKFDADGDGKTGSDEDLKLVIQKGGGAFGGSPLMAPNPSLSDDDVANVIVDGLIDSPGTRALPMAQERPEMVMDPVEIADAFFYLHRQHRSVWTHELQLTPHVTKPSF